ncbi:hypothetical protein O7626_00455 [Micromonospora sp. WMMD1102]|uniref:hypothetical protein n=1 Tax=Micromonospora sp. WMMD1102 TaxID=3016105 RepID=UPI0024151877|nr:hypothetical protein [Micromonospora sp. WMMD1102]MDG4784344.1 hypothetical protein [Micromonospora sp. WMMD1102]MDG4784417.1 hypothetical protein [Micromonospora sp. WMMD1102]
MNRIATTLLDLAGLLLVAAGAYYLAEPAMGRAALLVAGGVLLGGSQLAARFAESRPGAMDGHFGERLREFVARWTRRHREDVT